jgi:hypothetical protein
MIATILWTAALAATRPVGLVGGAGFAAGPPSIGGGTVGRLWIDLVQIGLEAAARENLVTADPRLMGTIFVGLRRQFGRSVYARAGFSHHHETPWDVLQTDLGGAIAGTARGITHRSGIEAGGGLVWPFIGTQIEDQAGIVGDASVGWMPDATRPSVYVFAELDLVTWVGPTR